MNDSVILIPLEGDNHDQRNGVCFSMANDSWEVLRRR